MRVVEAASGLEFGFEERLKRGGRQRFWLKGWFPELARQERLELCAG